MVCCPDCRRSGRRLIGATSCSTRRSGRCSAVVVSSAVASPSMPARLSALVTTSIGPTCWIWSPRSSTSRWCWSRIARPTRYAMLETIRQYALERLAEAERDSTRCSTRHADAFLALAESTGANPRDRCRLGRRARCRSRQPVRRDRPHRTGRARTVAAVLHCAGVLVAAHRAAGRRVRRR